MNWFRWHHGTATDPKWKVIAGRANETQCNAAKHTVRISDVLAVWSVALESASSNETERGTVTGWDHEDVGAGLDLPTEAVERIWNAMQGKVITGQRLTAWEKRQPKREDHSTERVQRYRQRVTHETFSNAVKRSETPEERRREESTTSSFSKKKNRRASTPWMGRVKASWNAQFPGASPPPGTATALGPLFRRLPEDEAVLALDAYLKRTPADMINLGKFAATHTESPKGATPLPAPDTDGYVIHDWRNDPLPVFEPGH